MAYSMSRRVLPFMLAGVSLFSVTGCKEDNPSSPTPPTVAVVVPVDHETKSLESLIGDIGIVHEKDSAEKLRAEALAREAKEREVAQKSEASQAQGKPYLEMAQKVAEELGSNSDGNAFRIEIKPAHGMPYHYLFEVSLTNTGNSFPGYEDLKQFYEFDPDGIRFKTKEPYSTNDLVADLAWMAVVGMPSHPKIQAIEVGEDWKVTPPTKPFASSTSLIEWIEYHKAENMRRGWQIAQREQEIEKTRQALIVKTQPFAQPYLDEIEKVQKWGPDDKGRTIEITRVIDEKSNGYYFLVTRKDPKDILQTETSPLFILSFGLDGDQSYFEVGPRSSGYYIFEPRRPEIIPPYGIGNFQKDLAAWIVANMGTNPHIQTAIANAKARAPK